MIQPAGPVQGVPERRLGAAEPDEQAGHLAGAVLNLSSGGEFSGG